MKIVIVGCGRFGSAITEMMIDEGHDVIVVDETPEIIDDINDTLDALAILGNGADYNLLEEAGMSDTDVCIACTASDEVNLLVSCLSKRMGAKHTIARFRNQIPGTKAYDFVKEQMELDLIVSPEHLTAADAYEILRANNVKDVVILGATRISAFLAAMLHKVNISVSIIGSDPDMCNRIKQNLPTGVNIINADETDHKTLVREGLDHAGAMVALSAMDEENILTSLFAMETSVPVVITKIEKTTYTDIIAGLNLRNVIAPRLSTARIILDFVRRLGR